MDVGFSLRSEAVGAMRTAMVSAENLQLTLKPELSQEEQALTHSNRSPKETHKVGYCSKTTHTTGFNSEIYCKLFFLLFPSGYCFLMMLASWFLKF